MIGTPVPITYARQSVNAARRPAAADALSPLIRTSTSVGPPGAPLYAVMDVQMDVRLHVVLGRVGGALLGSCLSVRGEGCGGRWEGLG